MLPWNDVYSNKKKGWEETAWPSGKSAGSELQSRRPELNPRSNRQLDLLLVVPKF